MKSLNAETYRPHLDRLKTIFEKMDRMYDKTARQYGFHCTGCKDNCCLTRFYHHTHLEYVYVREGFHALTPEIQKRVKKQAVQICQDSAELEKQNRPIRLMCPLNKKELCLIYTHRPMICRLHGIAHELRRPGQPPVYGPGCEAFSLQTQNQDYIPFDRTPFYIEMAAAEKAFKEESGMNEKIKMTIAEMVVSFND